MLSYLFARIARTRLEVLAPLRYAVRERALRWRRAL